MAWLLDVSRSTAKRIADEGEVDVVKVRGSTKVIVSSIDAYLDRLRAKGGAVNTSQ